MIFQYPNFVTVYSNLIWLSCVPDWIYENEVAQFNLQVAIGYSTWISHNRFYLFLSWAYEKAHYKENMDFK